MVQMATPWRHPETGTYYIRRQIPAALRPQFDGRTLWKVGLGTKDPDEARRMFAAANAELEKRFADAQQALAIKGNPLDIGTDRARSLLKRAIERRGKGRFPLLARIWCCEEAASAMLQAPIALMPSDAVDQIARLNPELLPGDVFLRVVRTRSINEALSVAEDLIRWTLAEPDPQHPERRTFPLTHLNQVAVVGVLAEQVEAEVRALRAEVISPLDANRSRERPEMMLDELWETWRNKTPKPGAQCANETKTTIDDFIDFAGNLPVGAITRTQLLNFLDAVASLPAAMPTKDRALPFRARVAKFRDHSGKPLSPGSLKRRIGHLQALLTYAFAKNFINQNVGARIEVEGYKKTQLLRRPFLDGEYHTLFLSRLFTEPARWSYSRDTISDVTLAWLFLLGTTSGARIEEIGQTLLRNVKFDLGVAYLDLGQVDADVKNEHSRRLIPIHDRVLDLHFMKFVDALGRAGAMRLFPELHRRDAAKVTKEASKVAGRYIDKVVCDDPLLVFHSTRHKFKDLAREAGLQDRLADQITGHAPVTAGARYGFGARIKVLKEQLDRIQFEMIDWLAVRRAFDEVDWDRVASELVAMAHRISAQEAAA